MQSRVGNACAAGTGDSRSDQCCGERPCLRGDHVAPGARRDEERRRNPRDESLTHSGATKGRVDRATMIGNIRTVHGHICISGAPSTRSMRIVLCSDDPASEPSHKKPAEADTPSAAKSDELPPPLPLDLDVDLAIGTVSYRMLEIGKGRLIAKGDGHRMQATVNRPASPEGRCRDPGGRARGWTAGHCLGCQGQQCNLAS